MNHSNPFWLGLALLGLGTFPACESTSARQVLATDIGAVQLRSFQTRVFDSSDRVKVLRTVIATLQDLGFVVDKADETLGSISATKHSTQFAGLARIPHQLRLTVTVRPRGQTQSLVRANAEFDDKAVDDPLPYQDFFTSLEKAMFLTAQQAD